MSRSRHRLPRKKPRRLPVLARAAMVVVSVGALSTTAFGWVKVHDVIGGITVSQALDAVDRSTGAGTNILLIGLDSRKDQHGDELPREILDKLHAGDSDSGGYNTNTLILMHVEPDGAGGENSVAFSIPRDDYVPFTGVPGYDHIKIKEAYGLTKAYVAEQLAEQGVTDQQELETRGREAGRKATIKAVRELTGVPIDLFAEVNLAGFYGIAQSLGGVQVCLNHAVYDEYSGADFPAGLQTLDAAQSLAFVRQRHGLDNGDLDRTRRQQAFLLSVVRQLNSSGTFTDVGKLDALMDVAHKDVVLSQGWDPAQFKRLEALAGGAVEFRTLPVLRYQVVNGQDVNIVDPAAIRAEVAAAFGHPEPDAEPTAPPNPDTVVDVVNAGDTAGMAARVLAELTTRGFTAGQSRDPLADDPTVTAVGYGAGAESDARSAATALGIDTAAVAPDATLAPGRVRVVVDADFTPPPATEPVAAQTPTETETDAEPPASSAVTAGYTNSTAAGWADPSPAVGPPLGGDGIPCVN